MSREDGIINITENRPKTGIMKMKKLSLIMAGAFLGLGASTAMAQDAPSTIQRVSVDYDLNTWYPKVGDNIYYNGFGVGYNVDFRVSNSLPLYVGTGVNAQFLFHSDDIFETTTYDPVAITLNQTFINFNVPVNVSYRIPVANNFYMTPFAGLNFRVQAYGHQSMKVDGEKYSEGTNYFSDEDMGGEPLKRFQMGWHAGLNFEYNRVNLGLSYGTDFVKIHKNIGGSNFLVSLGYTF